MNDKARGRGGGVGSEKWWGEDSKRMRESFYDTHASKGALTHPDAHK